MATIFSKIVAGELPAHKVAEDDQFLAFLDINPLAKGHVLVIPKKETDYLFDIADDEYQSLWQFAKHVALGLEKVTDCKRVGVAVIGLEVAHAHIHLIPLQKVSDIDFSRPKLEFSQEELAETAADIRAAL